jgi:hypothetical protein
MEWFGIGIAVLALILSVFTYFKHDLKIKKQDALLNEYHIEKIKIEKEKEKKAVIEANVITDHKGRKIVKVYNKGKSLAKNVDVIFPENNGFEKLNNPCPIDIKPQNGIEIILIVFNSSPTKIEIKFEWQDDFKEINTDTQMIQI